MRIKLTIVAAATADLDKQNSVSIEVKGSAEWGDAVELFDLARPLASTFNFDQPTTALLDAELVIASGALLHGQDYAGSIVRVTRGET